MQVSFSIMADNNANVMVRPLGSSAYNVKCFSEIIFSQPLLSIAST
jgi:hypothetical protein